MKFYGHLYCTPDVLVDPPVVVVVVEPPVFVDPPVVVDPPVDHVEGPAVPLLPDDQLSAGFQGPVVNPVT